MSKDAITIFAIDPGPEQSAWVLYTGEHVGLSKIEPNHDVCESISKYHTDNVAFAVEWIESFGMPVGKDVFETTYWCGRFDELAWQLFRKQFVRIPRKQVKLHLCNSMRAKDANIRQALLDRFPPTGGGKTPQVGTVKQPGPLFGVKSHIWSALAVAVTVAAEKEQQDA